MHRQLHGKHLRSEWVDKPVQRLLRASVWNPDHESGLSGRLPVLGVLFSKLRPEVQLLLRDELQLCKLHFGQLDTCDHLRAAWERHVLSVLQGSEWNCLHLPLLLLWHNSSDHKCR